MSESTARVTFDLPIAVKERLEELARATDKPAAKLATEAISSFLEFQEWRVGEIERGVREADAGEFASDDEVAAVFSKWTNAG